MDAVTSPVEVATAMEADQWQHTGKSTWAAALWQDMAAQVENLIVKVHHVDAHKSIGRGIEEHWNSEKVDWAPGNDIWTITLQHALTFGSIWIDQAVGLDIIAHPFQLEHSIPLCST